MPSEIQISCRKIFGAFCPTVHWRGSQPDFPRISCHLFLFCLHFCRHRARYLYIYLIRVYSSSSIAKHSLKDDSRACPCNGSDVGCYVLLYELRGKNDTGMTSHFFHDFPRNYFTIGVHVSSLRLNYQLYHSQLRYDSKIQLINSSKLTFQFPNLGWSL